MSFADRIRNIKGNVLTVQTKLARGYSQGLPGQEGYVGQQLFPIVEVDKEEGTIPIWGKESFLVQKTERALRGASNVLPVEKLTDTEYKTVEHDLEYPIDYREEKEAIFDLRKRGTYLTTQGVRLRMERIHADIAQDLNNYAVTNKTTLTSTDQWTDKTHSSPKEDFKAAKAAIRALTGKEPNVCVCGYASFQSLLDHPELEEKIKYAVKSILNVDLIKEILDIENFYVGKSLYVESLTGGFVDAWADNVILAYVAPLAEVETPSWAYTLRVKGNPFVYEYDKTPKVKHLNSTDNFITKIVMAGAAYIINDTNVAPSP